MHYRGWLVGDTGEISPLDRMANGNVDRATDLTHTQRGVTDDGWFFLQTGGWGFHPAPDEKQVSAPPTDPASVPFLTEAHIRSLLSLPSSIKTTQLERHDDKARVSFQIDHIGENPEVFLHWGTEEALTFEKLWHDRVAIPKPIEGQNQFILEGLPAGPAQIYPRLFLRNDDGQFWATETSVLE